MITEDFVSFETAKLLKEKGFNWKVHYVYHSYKQPFFHRNLKDFNGEEYKNLKYEWCSAPTLQMAMKWLRKVYNFLLVVDYEWECDTTPYYFKVYRLGENGKPERVAVKGVSYDKDYNPKEYIVGYRDWERSYGDYSTYEQACEAAIKYCLENLI